MILGGCVVGVHPNVMGLGPINAGRKLSELTGIEDEMMSMFSRSTRPSPPRALPRSGTWNSIPIGSTFTGVRSRSDIPSVRVGPG